jgi:hypothetical protein
MPTSSELRTTAIKKYSDFKKVFVKIFLEVLGQVNSKNIINMNYIHKQIFSDTKYFLLFYIKKASGSLFELNQSITFRLLKQSQQYETA